MQPKTNDKLRVARWSPRCKVLGPGCRVVIWVQGCPFRCGGCVAPETLPFTGGTLIQADVLAAEILRLPDITGVTFSGGEPMSQADALCALIDLISAKRDLSFMLYTGFTWEHLQTRGTADQTRLLGKLDILVDGQYEAARHTDLLWRGSDNQRVLLLTERHADWKERLDQRGAWIEFEVDHCTLHWMGIPPRGFRDEFETRMRDWGLPLDKVVTINQKELTP